MDWNRQLLLYAFIIFILGGIIVVLDQSLTKGDFNLREGGLVTKIGMACTLLGVLGLVIGFMGLVFFGLGWLWNVLFDQVSPKRLAFYSLIIAPAPLLLPLLAKVICKLTGGTVDASQASACVFLGLNLNGLVHTLFMSYMLTFITLGLAVLGLMVSGVWALVKMF